MDSEKKLIQEEEKILEQEKEILTEIKKEEKIILGVKREVLMTIVFVGLLVIGLVGGFVFWKISSGRVYIESSQISAPQINLSSTNAGSLEEIYVNVGDQVLADTRAARVGNEIIKTKVSGTIIDVKKDIGKLFGSGEPIVSMVEAGSLRVVGSLDEDKGLKDISIGQTAVFTVDAFGSKKYYGTVDEISSTSKESGVVFSISDKREVKKFEVKVRFNSATYPELKNGMSAKIWIYKN